MMKFTKLTFVTFKVVEVTDIKSRSGFHGGTSTPNLVILAHFPLSYSGNESWTDGQTNVATDRRTTEKSRNFSYVYIAVPFILCKLDLLNK